MRIESFVALTPALLMIGKATAVLLVGFALTTLMARTSATARHLVWLASLLALLAIPVLAAFSPVRLAVLPSAWGTPAVAAAPAAHTGEPLATSRADAVVDDALVRAPVPPRTMNAPIGTTSPWPAPSLVQVLLLAWAGVAVALLAWLLHGQWSVRRILSHATDVGDEAWQGSAMEIADRLGLERLPRLVRADVTMPFACGLRTPVIVLPRESADWTPDRRTAVLLHELAHVRRHDIVAHTLGRVVSALYWFHPLAWTAARRLRAESERACDDLALACGTRASDYAEHLLEIVTSVRNHGTPNVAMAMATRSEFEGRMLAILDPTLSRTAPTRVQASTLAGGVMLFAIITGAMVPRVQVPAPGGRTFTALTPALADSVRDRLVDSLRRSADTAQVAGFRAPGALSPHSAAGIGALSPDSGEDGDAEAPARGAVPADSSGRAASLARVLRTDTAPSLRRIAAWGLHEFDGDDRAIDALVFAVRSDASARVREMAAWSLAYAGDRDRVAPALAAVLRTDRDRSVRETAAWALSEGADGDSQGTVEALAMAAGDADAIVRETALWGLGNASPRRAPAAVKDALTDRDPAVRATAAWALHQIEDGAAAGALESALVRETDRDVKVAMVRALSVMGDPAVPALQRIIDGGDAELRAIAIRSLAGRGADPWPQPRPRPRPYP
ncbi:MAG: HEAT repeat domain-containing protein [Gemmatimonadaceae bacterium]|nr:HEAT repeat domain-containing protein [Gemmatimonadaceae bacterium]